MNNLDLIREHCAEAMRLVQEIEDIKESYKFVMDEKCTSDEKHCACVPPLRQMVKELQAALDAANADAQAAKDYIGDVLNKDMEDLQAERDKLRELFADSVSAIQRRYGLGYAKAAKIQADAKAALADKPADMKG